MGRDSPKPHTGKGNDNMPRFDGTTLLRKITVKDAMHGIKYKEGVTQPTDLFAVWGYAREMRQEESAYKDVNTGQGQKYQRYFGDFKCRVFFDGAQFRSTQLILDNFSSDLLQLTFLQARKNDPDADVAFAYVIGIEPFTRGDETKFRHTIKPMNLEDDNLPDPLDAITGRMLETMPGEFRQFFEGVSIPTIGNANTPKLENKSSKGKDTAEA